MKMKTTLESEGAPCLSTKTLTCTVVSLDLYRLAKLVPPDQQEAEFRRLFGREPDDDDRRDGLARRIEEMKWLRAFAVEGH